MSDGKLDKGSEIPYKTDDILGGPAHSSQKHQMGYDGLGSSLMEKDPGLHVRRSGTDRGNKRQRGDCSVV